MQTGRLALWLAVSLTSTVLSAAEDVPGPAAPAPRTVPATRADHPGNVFLEDEDVRLSVAPTLAPGAVRWRLADEAGTMRTEGRFAAALAAAPVEVSLGRPGLGWYRLDLLPENGEPLGSTTLAVLARLRAPTPHDSPVCADSATAWFARKAPERQARFAYLARLAGVNWIRDRMAWGEAETAPGVLAAQTSYDSSASAQAEQQLQTLQVFHGTPGWATDKALDGDAAGTRFPRDLRHLYAFCKAMAVRYHGRVAAWEPWNEANIDGFGGHTIDEMVTLQKAAYLGFKAGDPGVTVCWNVYAGSGSPLHTRGVLDSEAWPYFETYNIHSYSPPSSYLNEMAPAREAACGKPLWLTECGIHIPWKTAKPWGDATPEDELRQARFLATSYASSLFAGVDRHFFFILGNYIENVTQFGLLRHDETPRPGYVALAAVGRFLASARCLGRTPLAGAPDGWAYAFRARPDGVERDLLLTWAREAATWTPPAALAPVAVYDFLGRAQPAAALAAIGPGAHIAVLPVGQAEALVTERPPAKSATRPGTPSPVVLQFCSPHTASRLGEQAHAVAGGTDTPLDLRAYNFADHPVSGTVRAEQVPDGWRIEPREWTVTIPPMGMVPLAARVRSGGALRESLRGVGFRLRAALGADGQPVLAFRLVLKPDGLVPAERRPLAAAARAESWGDNVVPGATLTHAQAGEAVRFDMRFVDSDPWGYPRLALPEADRPAPNTDALALTVTVEEGKGALRVQFLEANGANYITDIPVDPALRTPQTVVAFCHLARWGEWSKPDPDGGLRPEQVTGVLVGVNSERNSTFRMTLRDLAWVRF